MTNVFIKEIITILTPSKVTYNLQVTTSKKKLETKQVCQIEESIQMA